MRTTKAKNNKAAIIFLKNKALEARKYSMLPFFLTKLIYALTGAESVRYINGLKECTEKMLRIKGFYKKYPDAEDDAKKHVIAIMSKYGFFVQ